MGCPGTWNVHLLDQAPRPPLREPLPAPTSILHKPCGGPICSQRQSQAIPSPSCHTVICIHPHSFFFIHVPRNEPRHTPSPLSLPHTHTHTRSVLYSLPVVVLCPFREGLYEAMHAYVMYVQTPSEEKSPVSPLSCLLPNSDAMCAVYSTSMTSVPNMPPSISAMV